MHHFRVTLSHVILRPQGVSFVHPGLTRVSGAQDIMIIFLSGFLRTTSGLISHSSQRCKNCRLSLQIPNLRGTLRVSGEYRSPSFLPLPFFSSPHVSLYSHMVQHGKEGGWEF